MIPMSQWLSLFEHKNNTRIFIWCSTKISQSIGLDVAHQIHNTPICNFIKSSDRGFLNCVRCRECIDKLCSHKGPFSGYCVNGLYEFIYPVYFHEKYTATVYIGNLTLDVSITKSKLFSACEKYNLNKNNIINLLSTVETINDAIYYETLSKAVADYMITLLNTQPIIHELSEPPLVSMLIDSINNKVNCSNTLKCIAQEYHVHEKYLGKLFKKYKGCSFAEYRNDVRLLKASELLTTTNQKIIDISITVGYENVTYFNKLFIKKYNKSPLNFRNSNKSKIS